MLTHLLVRNLAVIDEVEVELSLGLTALTGETGAGKSILVDALGLALGERADSEAVRPGQERAEVTASFELAAGNAALRWLTEHDLNAGDACVLRRVVTSDGRSRGYINGNPAPMQTLREIGSLLVDICGQQAHQSLLRSTEQRDFLDQHGHHAALLQAVASAHASWQSAQAQFTALSMAQADRAARLELLAYQVDELRALEPMPGEFTELEQRHATVANAARITAEAGQALAVLDESEDASARDMVSRARQQLESLARLDATLQPVCTLLSDAEIQLSEAADTLRRYLDRIDADPQSLAVIEQRMSAMLEMARKHRCEPKALPAVLTRLGADLEALQDSDQRLEKLQKEVTALRLNLDKAAAKLTAARRKAAASLQQAATDNLQQLGMPEGLFQVSVEDSGDIPGPSGRDRVEYLVQLNPGMRPGPLAKVASGGELSRVSLALRVANTADSGVPTLIFDEVDAGVGGGVAEIVGEKLRALAGPRQVLCVTHLPQVASQAHQHLRVSKLSDGHSTRTTIQTLAAKDRIEEVARMLGGVKITERTRAHAAEMLAVAAKQRGRA